MIKKLASLLAVLFLILTAASFAEVFSDVIAPEGLEVHFIAVGRNDGILIICDGETVFIDSGTHSYGDRCVTYMKELGVKHLKYYIGTHAHTDHVGGGPAVLNAFPTDMILTNTDLTIEAMIASSWSQAEADAVRRTPWQAVKKGDVFTIGSATLTCIGPNKLVRFAKYTEPTENNNSLIFKLELGDKSFILTGDTTNEVLAEVMKEDPEMLNCTVFKSPHHNVGLKDEIAKKMKCDYYIFSTGEKYPPTTHVIYNAKRMGARVFITNDNNSGTVIFFTDGESIHYRAFNELSEKWKLDITSCTLKVGNTKSFSVTMKPSNMIETLYYESSDPSVAYPDPALCKIYAVSPGTCVIRAIAFDGSVREINVTVKAK